MNVIKKSVSAFIAVLMMSLAVFTVFADGTHFFDEAGYTTSEEAAILENRFKSFSNQYSLDIVAMYVESLDGRNAWECADDWYDSHSRGYGNTEDGIMLLVCPPEGRYYISTAGRAINIFGDRQLDMVESDILTHLQNNDWYNAAYAFCTAVGSVMQDGADTSEPEVDYFKYALIALGIGFLISLIILLIMKSNMNNVKKRTVADDYTVKNSFNITFADEQFLYRDLKKVKRPEPEDGGNGGGSRGGGSHRSSSGHSHGGRGGRF